MAHDPCGHVQLGMTAFSPASSAIHQNPCTLQCACSAASLAPTDSWKPNKLVLPAGAMEDSKGSALSKQLVVNTLLGYGIFGAVDWPALLESLEPGCLNSLLCFRL